jgi:hypothetical protein
VVGHLPRPRTREAHIPYPTENTSSTSANHNAPESSSGRRFTNTHHGVTS